MGKYLQTHTLISIKLGLDYRLNYVFRRGVVIRIEHTLLRKPLRYNKLKFYKQNNIQELFHGAHVSLLFVFSVNVRCVFNH